MIVLDTNVVSEPLKGDCNPAVEAWLDRQEIDTLFLTTISLAELRYGLSVLPAGKRKRALDEAVENQVPTYFSSRLLSFDASAATAYAQARARARSAGTPIGVADAYIAATALAAGFSVATRDTAGFEAAGVPVINPWEE